MSSALYIVLDRKIPGADTFANGKSLAKHKDALERFNLRAQGLSSPQAGQQHTDTASPAVDSVRWRA